MTAARTPQHGLLNGGISKLTSQSSVQVHSGTIVISAYPNALPLYFTYTSARVAFPSVSSNCK